MSTEDIIKEIPYFKPFLFVDELHYVNEKGACGSFTFQENLPFFKGHFKNYPITPGVILIETMVQIGGVCLGLYLNNKKEEKKVFRASSYNIDFFIPVYPNEKVTVKSEKIYFRSGKLKCQTKMENDNGDLVSKGSCSLILKDLEDE